VYLTRIRIIHGTGDKARNGPSKMSVYLQSRFFDLKQLKCWFVSLIKIRKIKRITGFVNNL